MKSRKLITLRISYDVKEFYEIYGVLVSRAKLKTWKIILILISIINLKSFLPMSHKSPPIKATIRLIEMNTQFKIIWM